MQNASILSAQSNSLRGTDVLLPDHALLRSSRYDSTERMRYSYVEPDGETYDVSEIVETEWGAGSATHEHPDGTGVVGDHMIGDSGAMDGSGNGRDDDLLAAVVGGRTQQGQGLGANLDRVLNRIRNGKVSLGRDKEIVSLEALVILMRLMVLWHRSNSNSKREVFSLRMKMKMMVSMTRLSLKTIRRKTGRAGRAEFLSLQYRSTQLRIALQDLPR